MAWIWVSEVGEPKVRVRVIQAIHPYSGFGAEPQLTKATSNKNQYSGDPVGIGTAGCLRGC